MIHFSKNSQVFVWDLTRSNNFSLDQFVNCYFHVHNFAKTDYLQIFFLFESWILFLSSGAASITRYLFD